MKPLFFILRKTIKNYIKELSHKPGVLILYILIIISVIAMIVISITMPQNTINFSLNKFKLFGAIVTALLLFITIFGVKQGINKGSSFFRISDVNFVFTAPISPQKVLIYGFLKQLSTTFFIIFFLIFQLPNLKNMFPIINFGGLIIICTAFLLAFSMSIIGLLTYSAASKNKKVRYFIEKSFYVIAALLIIGLVITYLKVKNPTDALLTFLNNKIFLYIPFIGWFKQVLLAALTGVNTLFFINILLILLFLALMMYTMYKLNTDYYEDVLQATELKEELIKNKKEGKMVFSITSKKVKKVQSTNYSKGAKAIFYRHLLEYRKCGILFLDNSTIFICIAGIGFGIFMPGKSINLILYFSVYILFFFVMQGKWSQELSRPYIYLLPFSSGTKLFYTTLGDLIKNAVNGIVLFVIAGILVKADPLTIPFCVLVYTSFASIFIYGDIVSRKLLGAAHSKNLEMFLKMLLILIIIIPDIIISIIIAIAFKGNILSNYFIYLGMLAYNVLLSFVLILIGKGIFENLELN